MRLAPKIAFAAAVIAIGGATGGAVIGAQIGDAEILQRASVGGERPGYDFQADSDAPSLARPADRPPPQSPIQQPPARSAPCALRTPAPSRHRQGMRFSFGPPIDNLTLGLDRLEAMLFEDRTVLTDYPGNKPSIQRGKEYKK